MSSGPSLSLRSVSTVSVCPRRQSSSLSRSPAPTDVPGPSCTPVTSPTSDSGSLPLSTDQGRRGAETDGRLRTPVPSVRHTHLPVEERGTRPRPPQDTGYPFTSRSPVVLRGRSKVMLPPLYQARGTPIRTFAHSLMLLPVLVSTRFPSITVLPSGHGHMSLVSLVVFASEYYPSTSLRTVRSGPDLLSSLLPTRKTPRTFFQVYPGVGRKELESDEGRPRRRRTPTVCHLDE